MDVQILQPCCVCSKPLRGTGNPLAAWTWVLLASATAPDEPTEGAWDAPKSENHDGSVAGHSDRTGTLHIT